MNAYYKVAVVWSLAALLVACDDEATSAVDDIDDGENPAEESLTENVENGIAQSQEQEEARPCPSITNFGQAYRNPCQLELQITYNAVTERFYDRGDRHHSSTASLGIAGSLNQLYPAPLFVPSGRSLYFGEEPHPPFLIFNGEVQSHREGYTTPTMLGHYLRPPGSHPTSTAWEAAYSGAVSLLGIERFERRRDDADKQCLTVGMELLVSGEGTRVHTLEDGSTRRGESGPPAYFRRLSRHDGWWEWGRTESGIGPHEVIVCEGEPPSGVSEDCERDPRSYYGDEVCASEHLEPCTSGNCQVDFDSGGWMIWYGMQAANEERSHWTFSGTVSTSDPDILKMQDTETTWSLNLDLFIVPQTLTYE